jgi:uncharacterized protein YdeI (YjbR/CyaY-like superfamily)
VTARPEPIFFASPEEWRAWLEEHHATETEVWMGLWKKHTGRPTVAWSDAVDQALCFGWIDTLVRRIDDERHMQRFVPRKPGSNWSKINVEKIARLTEAGLMRPAGIAAWEARREDRTGVYSFERDEAPVFDGDQEARFRADAPAWEWFSAQPPGYRRIATHWVLSAKRPETRHKRLATLIEDSHHGLRIKSQRRP